MFAVPYFIRDFLFKECLQSTFCCFRKKPTSKFAIVLFTIASLCRFHDKTSFHDRPVTPARGQLRLGLSLASDDAYIKRSATQLAHWVTQHPINTCSASLLWKWAMCMLSKAVNIFCPQECAWSRNIQILKNRSSILILTETWLSLIVPFVFRSKEIKL